MVRKKQTKLKSHLSKLIMALFIVVAGAAEASFNHSSDCMAYRNESIKCDVDGNSLLVRNKDADKQPYRYNELWVFVSEPFSSQPEGWAAVYTTYVVHNPKLNSDALLKDNYVRLIDYIDMHHLTMNIVNNIFHGAAQKQRCAADLYFKNSPDRSRGFFSNTFNIPGIDTPLDAMKLCNEADIKLLTCGLSHFDNGTYPGKSFRWLLEVCKKQRKFRGTVEEIYGNAVIAKSVPQSEVGLPPSFLEAWKLVGSTNLDNLTQIQSTKSVFSQLNTEWLGLIYSDEFDSDIYSNRNRVLAPLFFYVLGNSENLELSHRTRFKIDLINNIDLIFSTGPSVSKNRNLLERANNEKKEIMRLIESI